MTALFQSHAGSIEARTPGSDPPGSSSFNPTLVRLRPPAGSVSTRASWGFNPTLVRLRRSKKSPGARAGRRVSIPRWFD